jgi:hypothetical protein
VLLEFVHPLASLFEIVKQAKYVPTRSVYPNATETMNVQASMNAVEVFALRQKNVEVMIIALTQKLVKSTPYHSDKENA